MPLLGPSGDWHDPAEWIALITALTSLITALGTLLHSTATRKLFHRRGP